MQWWDEEDVIKPVHVGHHREYTQRQLIETVAIAALRRHAFSLQAIRRHLRKIKAELNECVSLLQEGRDVLLFANQKSMEIIRDPSNIKELMVNSKDAWHLISMQKELNQGPKRKVA